VKRWGTVPTISAGKERKEDEPVIKTLINPPTLPRPRGYNHAVRAWPVGRILFLAGQIGWTADERFVSKDVLGQFSQALANLAAAVKAGGGRMDDVVQMRIYVTDMNAYKKESQNLGKVWREYFGGYYPAITLVEVKGFHDERARVEIDGIAVLPLPRDPDDREVAMELSTPPKPAAKPGAPKKK
jgi:enamine deaminase RidA (YjgF/YER057c/UK114 family)